MDRLDNLVADRIERRLLQPPRLEHILSSDSMVLPNHMTATTRRSWCGNSGSGSGYRKLLLLMPADTAG
jgi:hypothetical protein